MSLTVSLPATDSPVRASPLPSLDRRVLARRLCLVGCSVWAFGRLPDPDPVSQLPFADPIPLSTSTDILSQRKSLGDLTGEVLVNGQKPDIFFKKRLGQITTMMVRFAFSTSFPCIKYQRTITL